MGSRETEGGVSSLETRSRTAIGVWLVTSPSLCPDIWLTGWLTALGYVSFLLVHRLTHEHTSIPCKMGGGRGGENLSANLLQIQHNEPQFPKDLFRSLCICANLSWWWCLLVFFFLVWSWWGWKLSGPHVQKGKIFGIFPVFNFIYLFLSNIKIYFFSYHE